MNIFVNVVYIAKINLIGDCVPASLQGADTSMPLLICSSHQCLMPLLSAAYEQTNNSSPEALPA